MRLSTAWASRTRLAAAVAVAAGGLASCAAERDLCAAAPEVRAEMEAEAALGFWSPDHEDALVARLIPGGYGGLYFSGNALTVVLVDVGKSEEAKSAFRELLSCAAIYRDSSFADGAPSSILVHEGQYDAIELLDWRETARVAFTDPEVTSLGISRTLNRLLVGVAVESAVGRVEDLLVAAAIPRDALVVEVSPPF